MTIVPTHPLGRCALRLKGLLAVAVGIVAVGVLGARDAAGDELKKLEGIWKIESLQDSGKEASREETQRITLEIKGTTLSARAGDRSAGKGTVKLDPSKTPKAIDLTPEEGPEKGKTGLGIYQLEGDTLKICIAEPGKERPKEFVSKPGTQTTLMVLKRVKP
jgi:uncharacterized protein (TIGR03067 family)